MLGYTLMDIFYFERSFSLQFPKFCQKKIYEVEVCSFCFTSYQILSSFIFFIFFVSLLNSLYSRVMTSNASQIPGDHVELNSYAQFAN